MSQTKMPKVDVIGEGVVENTNPNVLTVMNGQQKIEACQCTPENAFAIETLLKSGNVKWEKTPDGKYKVGFWGGDMMELGEGNWLTKYDDGSFGFIENKEFELTYKPTYPKEYRNGQPINFFSKKIIVGNAMNANEKTPELLAWLVDKNGNKMYEEKDGKFYVKSKEGLQEITFGENQYIRKDATGGFYPNKEKAFKKLIVLDKDQIAEVKKQAQEKNQMQKNRV